MSVTGIAIKRPLLLVVIFTILLFFGAWSYLKLNYNLLPKLEMPEVSVSTIYAGASAAEIETTVTKKLEDAFSSVEGLDKISSTSQESVSSIVLSFKSGTDIDKAERDVQRKADQVINDLPDNAEKPRVNKINLEETPVIKAAVTADMAPRKLYDLINNQLKPALQNVSGVGQVDVIGGEEREIQVNIYQDKLLAYGLSINKIAEAISNANLSFPAGSIKTRDQQLSIRYDAHITSLDQLRDLVILQRTGEGVIFLKDVAEVVDGITNAIAINHINGIPSNGIQIIKQSGANAVTVSEAVKKAFGEIENQYKEYHLKFNVSSDQSIYTLKSANAVMYDLMLAIVIVAVVMLAFLHSVRSSLFVLVALPASIIPAFITIYLLGFSLNIMTLMALSLVVGILVDDSIVVLENIYRHLETGADKRRAALDGRNEIGFAALSITLVDVVVFLPLALSGGIIGGILKEFSLAVVSSTLMSFFVSFTVTPVLASRFGKLERLSKDTLWGRIHLCIEGFLNSIREDYGAALQKVLERKRWLLLCTTLLILGSVTLIPAGFIGAAFMPETDQGTLILNMELEPSATLYKTNMRVQEAEKILLTQPEVEKVFSSIGFVSGSVSGAANNANLAELTLTLKDKKDRSMSAEAFERHILQELNENITGVRFSTSTASITGGADEAPIAIAVKGVELGNVRRVAEAYQKVVEQVPGTQFVKLSVRDRKTEIAIRLNREKMSLLGLDANMVGATLQNSFSGNGKSQFKQAGNSYNIMVRLDKFNRSDIEDVRNQPVINSEGQTILLRQFAEVTEAPGETTLQRINRLNAIVVQSGVTGRPTGTVSSDIKAKAASVKIPDGISIEYLGETQNQDNAFGSLVMALITAFLLVYLIMVALYENLLYPFVVLFSIPVALVGAFPALALTMETLNIFTITGMIMLLGLVSKNAILIVDLTNQLKAEGRPVKEALIEAGKERLRPIMMTTLAMIFGMLPIAMATGDASEIKSGMAWVIIGGLTSSMILTLFVVPGVYLIADNLQTFLRQRKVPIKRESKHFNNHLTDHE
jgi:HAE1 family hydrophobic/amphiphilic exporter-1